MPAFTEEYQDPIDRLLPEIRSGVTARVRSVGLARTRRELAAIGDREARKKLLDHLAV